MHARPTLVTLVYCLRDGEVLLLRRRRPPFPGLWTAPGGKVEYGESPVECALRELREETGLQAEAATLRGVLTETSPRSDWQWLIFAYVVRDFDGELAGNDREGTLRWWSLREWPRIPMPEADLAFFEPVVLRATGPGAADPHEQTFHYDADLRLVTA